MVGPDQISAMQSQNGHTSHYIMSSRLHVALLIKFTPEPPSIIQNHLDGRILMVITDSPVVCSVKLVEISTPSTSHIRVSTVCRNQETRFNNLSIFKVIPQLASACHIGFSTYVSSLGCGKMKFHSLTPGACG